MFAVTTAALPTNKVSTALRPVDSYLDPFFTQDWRLFAPNPISDDRDIWFSGEYLDAAGATQQTKWFDWSDVEVQVIHHNFVGGRAGYITNKAIGPINNAYYALTTDQRTIVNDDKAVALKGYVALHDKLARSADNAGSIDQFLRFEESIIQLGTGVLEGLHPRTTFTAVRYRITTRPVIPFDSRTLPEPARENARGSSGTRDSGWREPIRGTKPERDTIAQFLRRHR